jgi:hypothetical protein
MKVIITSKDGEQITGTALFSNGRGKKSITVKSDKPIKFREHYEASIHEFNLENGCRVIWGQGIHEDTDDWKLDMKDCEIIMKNGGG